MPIVANVSARAETSAMVMRNHLVDQVTGRVRWRESVAYMAAEGVTEVFEIGAGKALSGMIRRIHRPATSRTIGTPTEVVSAKES